jgi:hypothetical protein
MFRLSVVILALAASTPVLAQMPAEVDLRTPQAFENLKRNNPAHFEKVRQILAALDENPERVEGDWLQTNFDAHDVGLTRMVIKTSYPPKQVLSFRLEQVRYTLYLVRKDMVGTIQPLH